MQFSNQQQPSPFPFLDEIEMHVHPVVPYVLAAVGAVGGYWYGIDHDNGLPVVLLVGLGLIFGLLAVVLLKHLTAFLIGAVLVGVAGLGTFFLLSNEGKLRHAAPAGQTAPASRADTSRGLLDDLKKAVQ